VAISVRRTGRSRRESDPHPVFVMLCQFRNEKAMGLGIRGWPDLSPAVMTRLMAEWQAGDNAWQKRDLTARCYGYVRADGVCVQARIEGERRILH
jgi:transposase-like protein